MKTNNTYLEGISLANYKGFGSENIYIGPFQRFNFFIGPNNSGKSSILNFLNEQLPKIASPEKSLRDDPLSALDVNLASHSSHVRMGLGIDPGKILDKLRDQDWIKKVAWPGLQNPDIFEGIISSCSKNNLAWFERKNNSFTPLRPFQFPDGRTLLRDFGENTLRNLFQAITGMSGGGLENWCKSITQSLLDNANQELRVPSVALIPAIRQISTDDESEADWSGKGLIRKLVKLQNPAHNEQKKKEKFTAINNFLRAVTDNPTAQIEIPYTLEHVLVHMDEKTLPISALGTGIHEIVIIAAVCTLLDNQIVCIEEPEIHLHPLLQRRLVDYLEKETTNQYFIATHSASIIDAAPASVFHVSNGLGHTIVETAVTSSSKFNVFKSLGYRASDLLQANSIIWVEGPSDRIYLKHWISGIDKNLIEGIHYSIMFYGGRLLSHLTTSDAEEGERDIEALIAVQRLNRNLCVVIDSDKKSDSDNINATKRRILEELAKGSGLGWITQGREIENYIDEQLMTNALLSVYKKRYSGRYRKGPFDHVLPFRDKESLIFKEVDKVRVATAVTNAPPILDILDLRLRIQEIVKLIHSAN